jgi:DNA-directed RNA polymerase subunit E'/Rpb7
MDHLLTKIIEETFGECSKEHGHILSVKRIMEILNNEDTIFSVRFEADTLKPEAGAKFTGVVCMVYKDGIFVNVAEKQKMLIPAITLKGYTFDDVTGTYVKGKTKIKEGDEIQVVVTAVKYNKQSFSCVGSLA